jgi:hypothetical protein
MFLFCTRISFFDFFMINFDGGKTTRQFYTRREREKKFFFFHLPNENHRRYAYSFTKLNLQVFAEFCLTELDIYLL